MAKIRVMQVGIVGYGEEYLKPMLAELPNDRYELVGVVDPVADKSALYPRLIEQGIPIHATIEAFYESCGADLVIVAAPISFHRQYTVYALEHGKPGGGYIYCTSNVPFRGLPPERYQLVLDVWKKHREY